MTPHGGSEPWQWRAKESEGNGAHHIALWVSRQSGGQPNRGLRRLRANTPFGEWTDSKGKKRKTTDGNRYKALGNSFAVPVVRWLGERIERIMMIEAGNNYRKARMAAEVKAERAAAELGVSITTLFSWERGDTKPNGDNICAMAKLYGVSADYLLGLDA